MSNFWDLVWLIVSSFIFISYLIILFQIVVDLFRDPDLGGGSIVYVLSRGKSMAERQRATVQKARSDTENYIREVAGKSPAEQIAAAKALLDAGTITQEEYAKLKAKALA
jgi:hypothetical protein